MENQAIETNKPVIMIADDSMLSRRKLIDLLKPFDAIIIEAKDGRDTIKKIITTKIDCILLDLLMPEVTGYEVLEYMQNANIRIPVIVISADIQETSKKMCIDFGVKGFLNKPPRQDEVIQAIKQVISEFQGL